MGNPNSRSGINFCAKRDSLAANAGPAAAAKLVMTYKSATSDHATKRPATSQGKARPRGSRQHNRNDILDSLSECFSEISIFEAKLRPFREQLYARLWSRIREDRTRRDFIVSEDGVRRNVRGRGNPPVDAAPDFKVPLHHIHPGDSAYVSNPRFGDEFLDYIARSSSLEIVVNLKSVDSADARAALDRTVANTQACAPIFAGKCRNINVKVLPPCIPEGAQSLPAINLDALDRIIDELESWRLEAVEEMHLRISIVFSKGLSDNEEVLYCLLPFFPLTFTAWEAYGIFAGSLHRLLPECYIRMCDDECERRRVPLTDGGDASKAATARPRPGVYNGRYFLSGPPGRNRGEQRARHKGKPAARDQQSRRSGASNNTRKPTSQSTGVNDRKPKLDPKPKPDPKPDPKPKGKESSTSRGAEQDGKMPDGSRAPRAAAVGNQGARQAAPSGTKSASAQPAPHGPVGHAAPSGARAASAQPAPRASAGQATPSGAKLSSAQPVPHDPVGQTAPSGAKVASSKPASAKPAQPTPIGQAAPSGAQDASTQPAAVRASVGQTAPSGAKDAAAQSAPDAPVEQAARSGAKVTSVPSTPRASVEQATPSDANNASAQPAPHAPVGQDAKK